MTKPSELFNKLAEALASDEPIFKNRVIEFKNPVVKDYLTTQPENQMTEYSYKIYFKDGTEYSDTDSISLESKTESEQIDEITEHLECTSDMNLIDDISVWFDN